MGANLAAAVAGAANGSTICLNSGDYGSQNFDNIARTGFVTLKSVSGVGARMRARTWNSDYIRFQSLTLSDSGITNCSTNVEVRDSTFVPNGRGLGIVNDPCGVPGSQQNIVVDGNTFTNVSQSSHAGRLSVCYGNGVTISNNVISGMPTSNTASDGIQVTCSSRNVTIGPGNEFFNITQSACEAVTPTQHCDSIQFVGTGPNTVVGNYFHNSDVFIMAPDGSTGISVRNNVFNGSGNGYQDKIQFGSAASPTFAHNTVRDVRVSFDSKPGNAASSNVIARDNVMDGFSEFKTTYGSGCSNCSFSYSLYNDTAQDTKGTNTLIGPPLYSGGTNPTSFAGHRLLIGTRGTSAASDGTNIGIP